MGPLQVVDLDSENTHRNGFAFTTFVAFVTANTIVTVVTYVTVVSFHTFVTHGQVVTLSSGLTFFIFVTRIQRR